MAFVGQLKEGEYKRKLHYQVYTSCFQLLGGALSAVINYHNPENKPDRGICVANHTSPIDVLILACDNAYALVRYILLIVTKYANIPPVKTIADRSISRRIYRLYANDIAKSFSPHLV